TTRHHPARDTVLYDGHCRFCRSQIAILRRLDLFGSLVFTSLHDPSVAGDFPEIPPEELLERMYVVDVHGRARGGADAVRHLSRRLLLLWPLALVLLVPFTMPLWSRLYAFVARHRYRIAGSCDEGTCRLP
ncbi:MAG: thiol-disulfide oxidoreductase DCC family protein, partial [Planctomycetia bacterium]